MEYRDELYKYILRIVGIEFDAEDLVQETLLTGIEKRSTLKNEADYKSWLFRIARNKSIDFLKRRVKYSELLGHENDLTVIENLCDCKTIKTLAENNSNFYQTIKRMYLDEKKTIEEIRSYIISINSYASNMSIENMEAMILSDIDNLTQKQISIKLSIPLPTVKSRIQRARQKVKKMFFNCCQFEFDSRGQIIDYKPKG